MATVSAKVFKHHLKADGTYNVKIKIYHKRVPKWIDTEHFVTEKQLSKKMTIKDPFVNNLINKKLDEYRLEIGKLGNRLPFFNCEELKNYLETNDQDIDFTASVAGASSTKSSIPRPGATVSSFKLKSLKRWAL